MVKIHERVDEKVKVSKMFAVLRKAGRAFKLKYFVPEETESNWSNWFINGSTFQAEQFAGIEWVAYEDILVNNTTFALAVGLSISLIKGSGFGIQRISGNPAFQCF